MDTIDGMAQTLQQDIRDLRTEQQKETRHLNVRIDTVQKDITDRLDNQTKTLAEHFDKGIDKVTEAHVSNSNRISALEKWRWTLVGGGAALAFLISDVIVRIFYGPIGAYIAHFLGWAK
jgi:hypothetical protein